VKVGSLVTSNTKVYLDPPEMVVGVDEDSSWSEILEKDYRDIPFGPHQVGIVVAIRSTNIMKHAQWIKVLTPSGMGVCFSDELDEISTFVT
jgi:hypothetical protein